MNIRKKNSSTFKKIMFDRLNIKMNFDKIKHIVAFLEIIQLSFFHFFFSTEMKIKLFEKNFVFACFEYLNTLGAKMSFIESTFLG